MHQSPAQIKPRLSDARPTEAPLRRELTAVGLHGMPLWKWLAMHAYYGGTATWRRWQMRRAAAAGRAPGIVLLFHRVASDWANEWTTHTDSFVAGIRWLKKNFELVSLDEVQRRVRAGQEPSAQRPCVAITFDDGYAENCDVALPLLVEEQVPCTYFVSTRHALEGCGFEHDLQMGNDFRPNTIAQLRHFAAAGIDIGAHTRTHAHLGRLHGDALYDEIVLARDELQGALGYPVRWFAFPFGSHQHMTAEAVQVAYDADFAGVVSAYGGYNFPGDDPFHLQRIGVDGPMIRLKNWTLFDPVKQLRMPRFQYSLESRQPREVGAI